MVWPRGKQVLGLLVFVGFLGVILALANVYINELPVHEQASTWRWFLVGWVASTVVCGLLFLQQWRNNTMVTGKPAEVATWRARYRMLPGICVLAGVLGGLTYPGDMTFRLAFGSLLAGADTALIIALAALIATKRGRAMIDKANSDYTKASRNR